MKRREFLTLSVKAAMAAGFTSAIPVSLLRTHTAHAATGRGAGMRRVVSSGAPHKKSPS